MSSISSDSPLASDWSFKRRLDLDLEAWAEEEGGPAAGEEEAMEGVVEMVRGVGCAAEVREFAGGATAPLALAPTPAVDETKGLARGVLELAEVSESRGVTTDAPPAAAAAATGAPLGDMTMELPPETAMPLIFRCGPSSSSASASSSSSSDTYDLIARLVGFLFVSSVMCFMMAATHCSISSFVVAQSFHFSSHPPGIICIVYGVGAPSKTSPFIKSQFSDFKSILPLGRRSEPPESS
jgi:hypothetical protein